MNNTPLSVQEAVDFISKALKSAFATSSMNPLNAAQSAENAINGYLQRIKGAGFISLHPGAEPEYDAATCITAGELREMGILLRENIPDAAWVPRSSMHVAVDSVSQDADDISRGILRTIFDVSFSEPFRWVSASFTLPDEAARMEL